MHKMQTERRLKYEHMRHSRESLKELRKAMDPVQLVKLIRRGKKFIFCAIPVLFCAWQNMFFLKKKNKICENRKFPIPVGFRAQPGAVQTARVPLASPYGWSSQNAHGENSCAGNWGQRSDLKGEEEKGISQHGDTCSISPVCSWCVKEQKQPNNEEQAVPMSGGKRVKSHERVCAL